MPICKNCHARITRFDKDMCPVCGTKDPFTGISGDTVEITSELSLQNEKLKVSIKRKWIASLLAVFIPFFGTPFYYLGYIKQGLVWLLFNIVLSGVLFTSLFFFVFNQQFLVPLIISLVVTYVFNFTLGIHLLMRRDYKDKRGELVR